MSPVQIFLLMILAIVGVSLISNYIVTRREESRWAALKETWKKVTFSEEEIRKDIEAYKSMYRRVHPAPFQRISEEEFERQMDGLAAEVNSPVTRSQFYCRLAGTVSSLNDEHTQVLMPAPELDDMVERAVKLFPYPVCFLSGKCYLAAHTPEQQLLPPGTEILAINGVTTDEFIAETARLFWGTRAEQRQFYAQQNFAEALYFRYGFEESFTLLVRESPDAPPRERRVVGKEFQRVKTPPFSYEIKDSCALFRFYAFEDPQGGFKAFLDGMFTELKEKAVQKLVIDIRENQGGASSLGDLLLRYLAKQPFSQFSKIEVRSSPEVKRFFLSFLPAFMHWLPLPYIHPLLSKLWRSKEGALAPVNFKPIVPQENPLVFCGKVDLLIGPGSMSSASLLAATIKQDGLGRLLGEPTGGTATHFGNMLDLFLPETGLKVMIPSSINYGNGSDVVTPDHTVVQTPADLTQGKDSVLEYSRH